MKSSSGRVKVVVAVRAMCLLLWWFRMLDKLQTSVGVAETGLR